MVDVDKLSRLFSRIVRERSNAIEKYVGLLEANGVEGNNEAINQFAIIVDSDRHLNNLFVLGAKGEMPLPFPRI